MNKLRILIMTAVEAERAAVMRGLGSYKNAEARIAGVGPAAAAASTATVLTLAGVTGGLLSIPTEDRPLAKSFDLVISAGIGGGFADIAPIGSLVVASDIIAADLGAETPEGYMSVDKLGFGASHINAEQELSRRWTQALQTAGLTARQAPVLTLSTVTGTAATAQSLALRYPGAGAEAMEGYGVAEAARQFNLPALEIRAISNAVGPRDREAWRIGEALQALEQACTILTEVLSS